jgi:hypothetical protein
MLFLLEKQGAKAVNIQIKQYSSQNGSSSKKKKTSNG